MPLSPGTRLGSYEVTALIGQGAMGEVYRATDTAHNRDVAIKLPGTATDDESYRQRFQSEARAAGRLRHPNVVAIYGVEESPAHGLYLVSEFVNGETLAKILHEILSNVVDRLAA